MEKIKIDDLSKLPIANRYPPEAKQNLRFLSDNALLQSDEKGKHGVGKTFEAPTISVPFSSMTDIHMLTILPESEKKKIKQEEQRIIGNRYIKIKYYQRLMMEVRGYDISQEPWEYGPNDGLILIKDYMAFINEMQRIKRSSLKVPDNMMNRTSLLDFMYIKKVDNGPDKTCTIFYVLPEDKKQISNLIQVQNLQILTKGLRSILIIVEALKPNETIFISPGSIKTSYVENMIKNNLLYCTKTTVFNEKYFMYNVTEHILQPIRSVRIIPENPNIKESVDDAAMLRSKKIDFKLLPNIPFNSPYIQYFGYEVGDVVKIEERVDYLNVISETQISYVRIGPYRNLG